MSHNRRVGEGVFGVKARVRVLEDDQVQGLIEPPDRETDTDTHTNTLTSAAWGR